jgi:hypothetical protein
MAVRSAFHAGRSLTPRRFLLLVSVRDWVDLKAKVWLEGLAQLKSLVGPRLWSSGQSSWQQTQRFRFNSRRYQIFWEVVGLERGPLSLVSTTEELLEKESSNSGLEIREYGRRDPSCWPHGTLCPQKLPPTSPTSGGRSADIVRSQTTES